MKINHNSSNETKVPVNTINTMMEQISDLQEDVSEIQNEIDGLGQSISTVSLDADNAQIDTLNTTNLSSTGATVNTLTASVSVNTAEMSASTSHLGNADAGKVDTEILEAETASIDVGTVTALESVDADITRANIDSLSAGNAEINTLETNGITNTGDYTGKDISAENVTASNTVNTKDLNVTDTANIKDLNISGHVSGVADITLSELETNELKATDSEIKTIKNEAIYTDNSNPLTPTPLVDNNDTYTIELPVFTGSMILIWKDNNYVKWTATVIGNGTDYTITWSSPESENYVQKLFQWNRHLYIRHNANGQLLYSYSAEKELGSITIYYNMGGWPYPEDLETLCDENHKVDVIRPDGIVQFGAVNIPMLETGDGKNGTFNFKGECAFADIPDFSDVLQGDVWNITDEAYTDNRFVEGAGKPINAGDDIIAVVVEIDDDLVMKWDKLSAGVNYDNFVARNITATSIKKNNSEVLTEADKTNAVTENSTDVLTSGGAYTALATKQDNLTFDNAPTENSSNPVKSGGVFSALATKQDNLTFDNVPTENSNNPVKSGGVYSALNTKINNSEKGIANGVATLDATGRVPYNQLPESAMEYKGTWDASTNTPTLADGTGTNGDFYVVSAAGTVTFSAGRSITFYVNDRVIYDGTLHEWERLPAGEVRSVNGQTGDVTLSIPTATSQLTNDSDFATNSNVNSGLATKVNKTGDTITGDINRSAGGSWISAREHCVVRQTMTNPEGNSWNPVIGVKTEGGHWSMGSVGGESLMLSYDTDTNYVNNNNTSSVINFPPAGTAGTLALTSQIPTVVDTVADGNMNAVTSNAVYDYIDAAITQVLNTGF